ncbi:RHS repeat-associated core domain-containing protein, partial [Enterobacter sp. BIDMC 26]|uniref:RHS repeat-associated core domain-containing protein n=1 Tax=Enterobacter sp. BIDMC 26 TaxID=1329838 RepID=UPI000447E81B
YSHDNLTGSSGLELDGDGNIISTEEYYPFGGTAILTARSQLEADYKTVRYSGKERDATGLYYYGYRYYQPWAGRWLSSDPAGTVDGLNLFRMCRNNPATFRDPDGKDPTDYNIIVEDDAQVLYRADGRSPEEIVAAGGFSNSLSSNTDGTLGRFENGETIEPIIYTAETLLGMKRFARMMPGLKYFYRIDASGLNVARYSTNFSNLKAKKNITQHLKQQAALMEKVILTGDWTKMNDVALRKDLTSTDDNSWMNLTESVAEVHIIGAPELLIKREDVSKAMNDPEMKAALAKRVIVPYTKITYIGDSDNNVIKDESKHIKLADLARKNELS